MNRFITRSPLQVVMVAALAGVLAGCAGQQRAPIEQDPLEGFNRNVFAFNSTVDTFLLRPVAQAYDWAAPDLVQAGVGNFFSNLERPVVALNHALQGEFGDSGKQLGRFLLNSTVGLLGILDPASDAGLAATDEDFGQTLGEWGYTSSTYLVLPLLGPSTTRDLIGRGVNGYTAPLPIYTRNEENYFPMTLNLIDSRAALLPRDKELREAQDPYALLRDAYLQRREYLIYDGDPPLPDYDSYELESDRENKPANQ